jgi:hypothetical protein
MNTGVHTDPPASSLAVEPESGRTEAERYYATVRGKLSLWTGVLGGAFVWAMQLQVGYALSRFSGEYPSLTIAHHLTSAIAVLLAFAATLLAFRDWRRVGAGEPGGTEPGVAGRARFLAALGILTSGLFTIVILAQWLPTLFIDPSWY